MPEKRMRAVGWIRAEKAQERRLRELGVQGHMQWKSGVFEYCEIGSDKVIQALEKEFPEFAAATFTLLDDHSNQLPPDRQRYWNRERLN